MAWLPEFYLGNGHSRFMCTSISRAKSCAQTLLQIRSLLLGMIGYGMAKAAVHHLVKSLSEPDKSGLPEATFAAALLPITLDTPMNRKWMPNAGSFFQVHVHQIYNWATLHWTCVIFIIIIFNCLWIFLWLNNYSWLFSYILLFSEPCTTLLVHYAVCATGLYGIATILFQIRLLGQNWSSSQTCCTGGPRGRTGQWAAPWLSSSLRTASQSSWMLIKFQRFGFFCTTTNEHRIAETKNGLDCFQNVFLLLRFTLIFTCRKLNTLIAQPTDLLGRGASPFSVFAC